MEERREGEKEKKTVSWCWLKATQSGKRDGSEAKGSYCSCRVCFLGRRWQLTTTWTLQASALMRTHAHTLT